MLVLGLMGPAHAAESPSAATVTAPELEIFNQPDVRSISSGHLRQGEQVSVRAVGPDGWLAIDPPDNAFLWIDQSTIDPPIGRGRARVITHEARLRTGIPNAKLPGPPMESPPRGALVHLLGKPPLTFGGVMWRAIAPLPDSVRYVRTEGVTTTGAEAEAANAPREARASFLALKAEGSSDSSSPKSSHAPAPALAPTPAIAAEIARIEASHRSLLVGSLESWQLEPIKQRYEALLKQAKDSVSVQVVQAKLDEVTRQLEAAEAARSIESILQKSKTRDRKLALYLSRLALAEEPDKRPYDAQGMIQPSSRMLDGQKLYALIGPKGTPVAYLEIPAGLDASRYTTSNVGIRGTIRYDESLHSQLISVRDLEALTLSR